MGIKYLYNDAEIIDISTEPQTSKEFDYAEAVFTEKDVTIKVAGVSTTYQIKNSSYKKMVGMKRDPGLKATVEALGMTFDGIWHTAFDDALNTGKILHKMIDMGWEPQQYMAKKIHKVA